MPEMPIKGFANDTISSMIEIILKILNPFLVYFSKRKKTRDAIIVGIILAIIIGTTVIGTLG